MKKSIKIGSGSGFSEDWVKPAANLARYGDIDYLIFEALAERTIHDANIRKSSGIDLGYGLHFQERMKQCALPCLKRGVKIITNDGAANPEAAAVWLQSYLKTHGQSAKIAVVEGDDVLEYVKKHLDEILFMEAYHPFADNHSWLPDSKEMSENLMSANCYLPFEPVTRVLASGADIVITGRVADPSLFVAALAYEFNWKTDDWDNIALGTVVGHLLECSGQSTGGYFANGDRNTAFNLADIGFPVMEVNDDGEVFLTKLEGSGGNLCKEAVIEQLHYEVSDFDNYITPDVVASFAHVRIHDAGPDRLQIKGFSGRERTPTLKALLGYYYGYNVSLSIRYRGHNALKRAIMTGEIWKQKLVQENIETLESAWLYNDLPQYAAVYEDPDPKYTEFQYSAIVSTEEEAKQIARHFMGLYLHGPYGGGGIDTRINRYSRQLPVAIDRGKVNASLTYLEV